jgi:hypothetical protein
VAAQSVVSRYTDCAIPAATNNGMIVDNELANMWKEADVTSFMILSKHFSVATQGNHETISQDNRFPGKYSNVGSSLHGSGLLRFCSIDK